MENLSSPPQEKVETRTPEIAAISSEETERVIVPLKNKVEDERHKWGSVKDRCGTSATWVEQAALLSGYEARHFFIEELNSLRGITKSRENWPPESFAHTVTLVYHVDPENRRAIPESLWLVDLTPDQFVEKGGEITQQVGLGDKPETVDSGIKLQDPAASAFRTLLKQGRIRATQENLEKYLDTVTNKEHKRKREPFDYDAFLKSLTEQEKPSTTPRLSFENTLLVTNSDTWERLEFLEPRALQQADLFVIQGDFEAATNFAEKEGKRTIKLSIRNPERYLEWKRANLPINQREYVILFAFHSAIDKKTGKLPAVSREEWQKKVDQLSPGFEKNQKVLDTLEQMAEDFENPDKKAGLETLMRLFSVLDRTIQQRFYQRKVAEIQSQNPKKEMCIFLDKDLLFPVWSYLHRPYSQPIFATELVKFRQLTDSLIQNVS